jgi:hypothetical protein
MSLFVPHWKAAAMPLLAPNLLIAATLTKLPHPQCSIDSMCSGDFTLTVCAQKIADANYFSNNPSNHSP